jgi:hypothetical protein
MSQTGSTAIYSGSTNAFQNWSGATGSSSGTTGTGFVFGTGISTVPSGLTGTTVLIQSATTNWVTGQTVYISAVVNGGVTPTPTPTNTETPTNTPTPTETLTPTPSVTANETPTPTTTSTPTPTPTSGATGDGWLFYAPEGPITVGPPDNNGNSIFVIQSTTTATYNPNYTGATLQIYFNSGTTLGTSYLTQFQNLDANGGTLTASQGSNTVIYSGNSSEYVVSPTGFLELTLNRTEQMVQSASTPFVSGTSINVVVS